MSSSSDDSDAGPQLKRKRKSRRLEDSPASISSGSPIIGTSSRVRRRVLQEKNVIPDSTDSDSDSGSSIHRHNKRKKVVRVRSDTESESSGSTIVKRTKRMGRISSESDIDSDMSDRGFEGSSSSQWETDFSDTELPKTKTKTSVSTTVQGDNIDSDSSDGQSEKCPICLLSFKSQQIGTPESCDHMFCLECIQEWSKNMNTCPVDRQEYNLVLVRQNINGKIIKQIPVERPTPQNDVNIVEDPTFCEICGTSDNEDRMLLCDGCDLGFHLYCLTPPLDGVPAGSWYCNDCSPGDVYDSDREMYELQLVLFNSEPVGRHQGQHRNRSTRLIPRTRQNERVRRRIANNRQQNIFFNNQVERPSSSGIEDSQFPDGVSSSTARKKYRKNEKPKKRRKRRIRYKTVYMVDEVTGETVAVKKRQKKRKSKKTKKARANRTEIRPKTVKKRLARQLGICAPRAVPQNLPDIRIPNVSNTIGEMRYQAGIPALHLFGQNNQLDYFSEDNDDYVSGPQVLIGRVPNHSDLSALRRVARRKAAVTISSTVSSSSDLLDSILNSQEQFHSRNSSYSVDATGKFKIEHKQFQSSSYVDINTQQTRLRQTPNFYPNQKNQHSSNSDMRANVTGFHSNNTNRWHSLPTSTIQSASTSSFNSGAEQNDFPQDYTQRTLCASMELNTQEKKDKDDDNTGTVTPNSESEVDIYSDIETVSTSKADECDLRPPSPPVISNISNTGTDDDNNDSEPDMVIDDDKIQEPEKNREENKEETTVTSTVGYSSEFISTTSPSVVEPANCSMEIQSGAIQSSNLADNKNDDDSTDGCPNTSIYSKESINVLNDAEDVDSDDECPNFSIYSKESKNLALHTDISLSAEDTHQDYQVGEISSSPNVNIDSYTPMSPQGNRDENIDYVPQVTEERSVGQVENNFNSSSTSKDISEAEKEQDNNDRSITSIKTKNENVKPLIKGGILGGLYSDSEDENVVKKDNNSFAISDINHMTEDISEEERSYTPCLDERANRQGLEGLDTEMISDEDRNDFDETHDLKTVSDGEALEINAKESELDFTRPEDYEEGEIVDKNKAAKMKEEKEKEKKKVKSKKEDEEKEKKPKKKDKEKSLGDHDKGGNKENESHNKESSFKKLSKNNKDRNYRDKERDQRSSSKQKDDRDQNKKEKKKEKRKELERYNVRALIADKPRPQIVKDQFGRDIRRSPSRSRSRSYTPPIRRSLSRGRRSPSNTRRSLSRSRRSLSRRRKSVSNDRSRKRRARSRKQRSISRSRSTSPRKNRSSSKNKKRKRSTSRYAKRRKSSDRSKNKKKARSRSRLRSRSVTPVRRKRDWSRREWTPTLSMSPSPEPHVSPSWTPPRLMDNSQVLRNENLTVVVNNNKKKKEKKRKNEKRSKESTDVRQKKRRLDRERTPPPSKEVFASGDNILVSVSFNNDNEIRDITTRDRRKKDAEEAASKKKKEKRRNRVRRDISGLKPVAIIDLERSPFKEITPSPKDIIVLSDSDNNDNENIRNAQKSICDSSQQVASPERSINYSMGPKTPPEPQVKFSLTAKPPQVRAISNPLHEPDDMENNDVQEEINSRINEGLHKGPNTPPEPPNSPPSSPDAYDPFEPTKSRSPTPDPMQTAQSNAGINLDDNNDNMESRSALDLMEKATNQTPDVSKSLTPPIADVQPADSQSSIQVTPESNLGKSPERIGVVINQTVQPPLSSKPMAQTTPFSSVPTSLITSTPVSTNLASSRINILNATIITPPHVASSIPQRIVLPNQVKSSPVKISPTKAAIKSTPIKPMPSKSNKSSNRKNRTQNGNSMDELNLDLDSPYSPGSSDYEDLFEPPSEIITKPLIKSTNKSNTKSPQKHQSVFDALFGSPSYNKSKTKSDKNKFGKKSLTPTKTKTVGVKLDEDNLKILDELPNSAVEMQVKDKFLKKLNRQERVVEEVKLVLKPHYNKKKINKEEYKDILRRSVPKICHNKSGEINPTKIKNLIEAYVRKIRHSKKVTSSSSVNPQKV